MATEWFYGAAGTQAGPHSEEEIRNLISSGTISRETLVWHQGMNDWTAAGKIQQFFGETKPSPQSSSASANPANPYAVSEASVSGATSAPHSFENYPHFPVKRANFTLHLVVALALPIIATILMVVAVVKAGPTDPAGKLPEEEAMAVGFSFMTAMGLFYVGLIAASVIGYIHLYRAFYCLQPGGCRTTPGKAVGFLFIPFFNLYWLFVAYKGLADDWNRIMDSYADLRSAPRFEGWPFLTYPITLIVFYPVAPIFYLMCHYYICKGINFMAERSEVAPAS